MITFILQLAIFLVSVIIHEVSHGYVAEKLGDPTARNAGRLNLNPLNHIDPFGSVVLPLILAVPALFGANPIIFGWAKPVPYDPRNLKNPRVGGALIAAAGPLSNLVVAAIFGFLIRMSAFFGISDFIQPMILVAAINVILAVFNLIPIPPLDGSKLLYLFLPENEFGYRVMDAMERYGFLALLAFIIFGYELIYPIVEKILEILI